MGRTTKEKETMIFPNCSRLLHSIGLLYIVVLLLYAAASHCTFLGEMKSEIVKHQCFTIPHLDQYLSEILSHAILEYNLMKLDVWKYICILSLQ